MQRMLVGKKPILNPKTLELARAVEEALVPSFYDSLRWAARSADPSAAMKTLRDRYPQIREFSLNVSSMRDGGELVVKTVDGPGEKAEYTLALTWGGKARPW